MKIIVNSEIVYWKTLILKEDKKKQYNNIQ